MERISKVRWKQENSTQDTLQDFLRIVSLSSLQCQIDAYLEADRFEERALP